MTDNMPSLSIIICLFICMFCHVSFGEAHQYPIISEVRFLLTVNDTWDQSGCIHTVATDWIEPSVQQNFSKNVVVGKCDHGALDVKMKMPGESNKYTLYLTFHSYVIEDADPPTCTISWNGTYLEPTKPGVYEGPSRDNPLPSCFTSNSREGWYLTYYWFHILDWKFAN